MTSKALVLDVHPEWPILVVGTVEHRQDQPWPAGLRRGGQKPLPQSGQGLYPRRGHRRHRRHRQGGPAAGDGKEPAGGPGAQAGRTRSARRCPSISDRIIFLVAEVEPSEGERWTLDDAALREVGQGSRRRPLRPAPHLPLGVGPVRLAPQHLGEVVDPVGGRVAHSTTPAWPRGTPKRSSSGSAAMSPPRTAMPSRRVPARAARQAHRESAKLKSGTRGLPADIVPRIPKAWHPAEPLPGVIDQRRVVPAEARRSRCEPAGRAPPQGRSAPPRSGVPA